MSQQSFHEIIKYNSLCFVSEARPFNNNVLISGAQSYLQGTTGVENWVEFYLTNESKSYRIDGYGYDDEGEKLYFVFSEFHQDENVKTIDIEEIRDGLLYLSSLIECIKDNSIFDDIDESEQSEVAILNDLKEKIKNREIELLYLTNCIAPPNYEKEDELKVINYVHSVIGFSEMYRFHISTNDIENAINIDLNELNKGVGLDILMATESSEKLEGYLLNMPGRILAEIYESHKVALLESNIRFYLQDKANTNKGILRTIRGDIKNGIKPEPEMFFSYNNGISATCTEIELTKNGKLSNIYGLQIVNGGQTTASIHQILGTKHDSFLDKVSVQMKLSVIKDEKGKEDIIRRIAEYANTQNPIKKSDLTSNNAFIIALETFSKNTAPPSLINGKVVSKWFFERKVGEYNNLLLNAKKEGRFDAYVTEFPKNKMIIKTDFAKRAWAWGIPNKNGNKEALPYVASKSAEVVYRKYLDTIENNHIDADLSYYKESIAKEIIFKQIYSLLADQGVSGYKSNVALYTLAWLSYLSRDKVDLILIWDVQDVSTKLIEDFKKMIPIVHSVILTPNNKKSVHFGKNIGEFTKKEECWNLLKKKTFVLDIDAPEMNSTEVSLVSESNSIYSPIEETHQFWTAMSVWALSGDHLSDSEKSMMFSVAKHIKINKDFSVKQEKFRNSILAKALSQGYIFEDELDNRIVNKFKTKKSTIINNPEINDETNSEIINALEIGLEYLESPDLESAKCQITALNTLKQLDQTSSNIYIKKIVAQDLERTASIGVKAVKDFFKLNLDSGEECIIPFMYVGEKIEVLLNKRTTRNEYRIFLNHHRNLIQFEPNDILVFSQNKNDFIITLVSSTDSKSKTEFTEYNSLLKNKTHLLINRVAN